MAKRPNIVIINPDEMRADAMGHMGNPAAVTPVLDRLAATEAVSFSNAFCQNPVCVPSRCSFLTGEYPHVRGHRTMSYLLREGEPTLFSQLKDAGYYVWMNGRNDLVAAQIPGLLERHATEIYYGGNPLPGQGKQGSAVRQNPGASDQSAPAGNGPQMKVPAPPSGAAVKKQFPYSHYTGVAEHGTMDADLDDTMACVDRILHRPDPDQPLLAFLGLNNPHVPYTTRQEYYDRIDPAKIPPRIHYDACTGKSRMVEKLRANSRMGEFSEENWTEIRRCYLAQCSFIDDMTGLVIDALKQAGIYDDTAIFFLSDHGDFTGDYDLPEKAQSSLENCLTRVPLLVKPPKGYAVDPGVTDSLAELVDFYATAMDYAGVAPAEDHFGRSLVNQIAERHVPGREVVFAEGGRRPDEWQCDEYTIEGPGGANPHMDYYAKKISQYDDAAHAKAVMAYDGRCKYIRRMTGEDEFYDLAEDPLERHNLLGKMTFEDPDLKNKPTSRAAEADVVDAGARSLAEALHAAARPQQADTAELTPEQRAALERLKRQMLTWYQVTADIVPRDYDSRFAPEKIWAIFGRMVPEEYREEAHRWVMEKRPGMPEMIRYIAGLRG